MIYKLILNGMPDENSNPIGANQTLQNNQVTTNQIGDDFVLDFGDEEKKEETKNNEGINNLDIDEKNTTQDSNQEIENENNINLDDDNLFGEEEEEKTESEEINIQNLEDEEKKEPINEEFNVSLDNEVFSDNSENDSEGILESKNEKTDSDYTLLEEDKEEADEKIEDEEVGEKIEDEEVEEKIEDEAEEPEETIEENLDNDVDNPEVSGITEEKDEEGEQADDDFTISMGGDSDEVSDEDLPETQNNTVEDNIQNDNSNDYVANFADDLSEDSNDTLLENKNTLDDTNNTEEVPGDEMKIEDESVDKDEVQEDIFSDSDLFKNDLSVNDNNIVTEDPSTVEDFLKQEQKVENIQVNEQSSNDSESENGLNVSLNDDNLAEKSTIEQKVSENINLVADLPSNESQSIKQPEIGELLGNAPVDFSSVLGDGVEDSQDVSLESENPITENQDFNTGDSEVLKQGADEKGLQNGNLENEVKENSDFALEYPVSNTGIQSSKIENIVVENALNIESDTQNSQIIENENINQKTSMYESDNLEGSSGGENNQSNEQLNNNQGLQTQENINKVNEVVNLQNTTEISKEAENKEDVQEIKSTLSLDQILDSELNNNPEFMDSSQAVPKNIKKSSGLFANKKMIGIISGILIFLLAGFVVVIAFPSKISERKIGDVVINTQDEVEDTHNSGSDDLDQEDLGEDYGISSTDLTKDLDEISDTMPEDKQDEKNKTAGSSVQLFPDVDTDDGDIEIDASSTEIEPYICVGDDCEEKSNPVSYTMSVDEIESVISDFKSYAQEYYTLGDETQDKKLVRYAAQIIYLCDSYQEQLENGNGNNQESFEKFETKVSTLKDKMINYFGSINNVENLNGDSRAEYEEVKNYINSRVNEMN